jgi:tyrosyl-tRNA synthetase
MTILLNGVSIADLCAEHTQVFTSKGELRRLVQGGGLSLNKVKIENPDAIIPKESLLNDKYLLVQKGKKNYYLIRVS